MRFEQIHKDAKHIDQLIDLNLHVKKAQFLPVETLKKLIITSFPDYYALSSGWHKIVFCNRKIDHKVVLKVGPKKSIENDHRTYKAVPRKIRHQFFARMFWHTKYCLLQEFGEPVYVSTSELNCLRRTIYKYGIFDIKEDNLRLINCELKIIDASITRIPLPTIFRKVDEFKHNIPTRLDRFIRILSTRFAKE